MSQITRGQHLLSGDVWGLKSQEFEIPTLAHMLEAIGSVGQPASWFVVLLYSAHNMFIINHPNHPSHDFISKMPNFEKSSNSPYFFGIFLETNFTYGILPMCSMVLEYLPTLVRTKSQKKM